MTDVDSLDLDAIFAPKTLEELREMAVDVAEMAGDPEAAHGAEDALMEACLESIAAGAVDPKEAALIGLSTRALDFDRWYA